MTLTATQTSRPEASWGSHDWAPLEVLMSCHSCDTNQSKSMSMSGYLLRSQ